MTLHHSCLTRNSKTKKVSNTNSALPKTRRDCLKYLFWRTYAPMHPRVRDSLIACKLIRHSGRQPFLLGHISSHISSESFIKKIEELGYHNHFLAWKDDDEVVSLRLSDGFARQYHLRVFSDGEVRGHYEYSPEAYPLAHLMRVNFYDTREFFLQQLKEYIVPAHEEVQKDKRILMYTRAFICLFYRGKRWSKK